MLNSERRDAPLGTRDYVGWAFWAVGFATEAIADQQKWIFKSDPNNAVSKGNPPSHPRVRSTSFLSPPPPGGVHPERTLGLQQTPQLPWRDPAVVGPLARCLLGDGRPPVPERGVPSLCLVPASTRQRNPDLGEAGAGEVGLSSGLPELRQKHAATLAPPQMLMAVPSYLPVF